ncbi:MAG: amidase [Planctomycetota bacterium]
MLPLLLAVTTLMPQSTAPAARTREQLAEAIRAVGAFHDLDFDADELALMVDDVAQSRDGYAVLRGERLTNDVVPPLYFLPGAPGGELGPRTSLALELAPPIERPAHLEELAFADIETLAALVRARRVSCVELTEMFLARLERHDATLHCVITLLDTRALAQARVLDAELEAGHWRGPLHGIPWVAKDLLAVAGAPTTWGATPFREQTLDDTATVVERLDAAGAVLLAKASLGALAWGDVWYDGTTRNPWNPTEGSSGSSAGSASATAAGLATFAIGSETLGSIVSPAMRCGNSALRPSFGLVPKGGAMNLAWSMDKLGPLARSVRDSAIVFDAIRGADPRDRSSVDRPFVLSSATGAGAEPGAEPQSASLAGRRVGYLAGEYDAVPGWRQMLLDLTRLGAELVEITLPDAPTEAMTDLLAVEAAAVFDGLTRSGADDQLVRQVRFAWPNVLRQAQLVSAVDYLRANRLRTPLIEGVERALRDVDALVHPSFAAGILATLNLTGHPTIVVPAGFDEVGEPFGLSFSARLFGESDLVAVADAWQRATEHHTKHPLAYLR